MNQKVILISIDGVRPDGALQCANPIVSELMQKASYTLTARTIFPSVTLPCHMSMFHSVPAERHGITTNLYMPPVRPVNGIFEQVKEAGGTCAMFYGWEPMRDISRPGSLIYSEYQKVFTADNIDCLLTEKALSGIAALHPDFAFLYLPETDDLGGHAKGWMSDTYLRRVSNAFDQVRKVIEAFGDEYTIIIATDHGGHDRIHGSDLPEDMTIPMFFYGKQFQPGKELTDVSILDLAPTIAAVLGIQPAREWEGKSLV